MGNKIVLVLLAIILTVLPISGGHAKPFYEGKTITMIVATSPGGGYDFYGRLMARFMQKYLPGSTIIVRNLPGAGHIIGCNELYHAKPNGLTLGTFNRALALTQLAGVKGVKFDLTKMSWLGSPCSELYSFIVTPKFKILDDVMRADTVRIASSGLGAVAHVTPLLFAQMTGAKNFKIVTGYTGGEAELAMMRGEIDGQFASWFSLQAFVEDGHGRAVMFIGKKQPKGYENVPLIQDVITEARHKPIIDLLFGVNLVGRPFAGPPGISQDRLQILQDTFKKACQDPDLLKIAKKAERPMDYIGADEAAAWAEGLLKLPPDVIEVLRQAYGVK